MSRRFITRFAYVAPAISLARKAGRPPSLRDWEQTIIILGGVQREASILLSFPAESVYF